MYPFALTSCCLPPPAVISAGGFQVSLLFFIAYCECLLVFSSNGKFGTFTSRNVCLFISVFLVKVDIQDM